MSRWSPDSRRRLQDAALELFSQQGYAATTAAAVAERAGLTERTFFRYFTDKKEVLFSDIDLAGLVAEQTERSTATTALGRAADGLRAVAAEVQADPSRVRRRAGVIAAAPELREREMLKYSQWTAAAVEALVADRVEPRAAHIAAEVATALFRIAYTDWTAAVAEGTDLIGALDDLLVLHAAVTTSIPRTRAADGAHRRSAPATGEPPRRARVAEAPRARRPDAR